jgi:hypothetical protein
MSFLKYLSESEKSYKYRIKTVAVDLSESEILDRIEFYLQRFKLIDMSRPFKTILQKVPLDFPNVTNAEVYMIDIETAFPLSSYVAAQELRVLLGIPENLLVVRGANEPIEIETQLINQKQEVADAAEEKDLVPAPLLNTEPVYPDSEQTAAGQNYYGDSYNSRLLDTLQQIADERKPVKFDPPSTLFKWLDMPKTSNAPVQDDANFNADIEEPKVEKEDSDAKEVSVNDNFSTENSRFSKDYINPRTGAAKTLVAKMPKK